MTDQIETAGHFAPVASAPGRVGQGTAIEQARAATQVQAAILVARQFPRDPAACRRQMLAACEQIELADEAFYEFSRGDSTVQGLTIVAACEIAQIWGNVEYGLNELRRDDLYGQSEQLAFAWDLETNVRPTQLFITPHWRDTKKGGYRVKEARDIYEVTTSQGNRRMRACILKILPRWYVLAAEAALQATLMKSVTIGDEPLNKQVKRQTQAFMDAWDVTRAQLEHKAERPFEKWGPRDLVRLKVLSKSLARGDLRLEEAFPARRVTADELPAAQEQQPEPPADKPWHTDHAPGAVVAGCPGCDAEYDQPEPPEPPEPEE